MEYPKIETLYERGENFKVNPAKLRNGVYSLIKTWEWTEKVDGTNIRCIWNPLETPPLHFNGRTDNAQIHAELVKWLYENVRVEKLAAVFPDVSVILFGEGYGAGIQKGGGLYSPTKRLALFDILVDGKWWLNWENTCDVATKLGLQTVPFICCATLEGATDAVRAGFQSVLGCRPAEGLVGRTAEPLFDSRGNRLIVKLKTKDF